jgi:hypothetical protein
MPPEIVLQVNALSNSGAKPREIASAVRQTTSYALLTYDIYNARSKLRLRNLAGYSPMEALIAALGDNSLRFNYRTDAIGHVTHLFFAHPKSVDLLTKYLDVLLLDCTYRTNKFKMPLLNVVGTTCLNSNFHAAFCFLAKEEEGDYIWAMQQLKELFTPAMHLRSVVTDREMALINVCQQVFPTTTRLFCVWHVEKNVLTHVSTEFEEGEARTAFMRAWTDVMHVPTKELYKEQWNALQDKYNTIASGLVQYILDTWII